MNKLIDMWVQRNAIDVRIEDCKEKLLVTDLSSTEGMELQENLERLYSLREEDRKSPNGRKIDMKIDLGSIISSAVGLVSIAMILGYEREDIVTTKSMTIAQKMLGK
jgi:hypothetical protein